MSIVRLILTWRGVLAVLLLSASAVVHAAGLGKLVVLSSLGEPFRAEIEWIANGDGAEPRLAAPADYARAHYPYNAALAGARLAVKKQADGRQVLEVNAIRPLNEPFVHVLLELAGPATRLLRGYTVLLDPPGYGQPFVAQPSAPVARTPAARAPVAAVPPPRNPPAPPAAPAPAAMSPDLSRRIQQLEEESAASAKTLADLMARIAALEEIAQRLQRELEKPPPAPAAKKPALPPVAPAATAAAEPRSASRPQSFVNEALLVLAGGCLLLLAWLAWVIWGRPRRG